MSCRQDVDEWGVAGRPVGRQSWPLGLWAAWVFSSRRSSAFRFESAPSQPAQSAAGMDPATSKKSHQIGPEFGGRPVSQGRVPHGRLDHDRLEVAGNSRIHTSRPRQSRIQDQIDCRFAVGSRKGPCPCRQLEESQPERINVAPSVDSAFKLFRGEVAQRSRRCRMLAVDESFCALCQAEIGDPDFPSRVEQQIGRLNIAVQNSM